MIQVHVVTVAFIHIRSNQKGMQSLFGQQVRRDQHLATEQTAAAIGIPPQKKPLTKPYVNLSIQTALITQLLPVIPSNAQIA